MIEPSAIVVLPAHNGDGCVTLRDALTRFLAGHPGGVDPGAIITRLAGSVLPDPEAGEPDPDSFPDAGRIEITPPSGGAPYGTTLFGPIELDLRERGLDLDGAHDRALATVWTLRVDHRALSRHGLRLIH